jgi:hypothetical protein
MAKKVIETEHKKWERVYEFEDYTTIWKYDSKKSLINPVEVEVKYKPERRKTTKGD